MRWKHGVDAPLLKDFEHTSGTTWEEHQRLLRLAKSPTVSVWLLQNMPKPSASDVRAFSRFLDSPDPRLRWTFVERLAAWTGEPAPDKPRLARDGEGRARKNARGLDLMEYPGLDAAVQRWKARIASGKPIEGVRRPGSP